MRGNDSQIKHSLTAWAKALGMSRDTIHKRLNKSGIQFESDVPITAMDIWTALSVDSEKDAAMTRKLNAEAEARERENEKESGNLVSVPEMERLLWSRIYLPLKVELEQMPERLGTLLNLDPSGISKLRDWVEEVKSRCREPKNKEAAPND